jgi:hypothetical protein
MATYTTYRSAVAKMKKATGRPSRRRQARAPMPTTSTGSAASSQATACQMAMVEGRLMLEVYLDRLQMRNFRRMCPLLARRAR